MAKGSVNWDSAETWQRIVAAIIASGVKVDMKQVALFFGTTYDTIENRFRKIKKDAAALKEEVDSGERSAATPSRTRTSPSGTPRKRKTPKKDALSTVTNGRVSKTTPNSNKRDIKKESSDGFTADFGDGDLGFHFLGSDDDFMGGFV